MQNRNWTSFVFMTHEIYEWIKEQACENAVYWKLRHKKQKSVAWK